MPIYLLAEDEGNEEEILRLLESESPGGSPIESSALASSPQDSVHPTEESSSHSVNTSSFGESDSTKETSISESK